MNGKNIYRPLLLIYLPYLVVLSIAFVIFFSLERSHYYRLIQNNEHLQIDLVQKSLVRDFENTLPDIEVIANERHVQQFVQDFDKDRRQQVEQEFASFARKKRLYRTIRFIDVDGMESVRVDYLDGRAVISPLSALQDMSQKYYYQEGIKLGQSELYISPIDLEMKNDKVTSPGIPIIRFAMCVYDSQQRKKGIIVLNYDANKMLRHFDEMLAGSYGHISLVNQDGFWIRSPKKEHEWAFMFNHDLSFRRSHPNEWEIIRKQEKGQIGNSDGLFTFTSVYPIRLIGGYSENEVDDQHIGHHHIDPLSYTWKIISDVPVKVINQKTRQHMFGPAGVTWFALAVFGLFTSRYLARNYLERKSLRNQIELHSQVYKSSTDGVIITDTEQRIIDVNQAFLGICGYSFDEIVGNKPSMFSAGSNDAELYLEMWRDLQNKGHWEGEIYNRHKDGSVYIEWLRITAIKDEHGETANYIALVSDITQKKSTEAQLLKHAHHDPLTGAHNRLSFDERLSHELLLAKRNQRKLALLYFDLNKFKPINDSHGHQAGDKVLKTVVNRVTENIRQTDTLARLGGDEFVVILAEIAEDEDAERIANSLNHIIQEPVRYGSTELHVDASFGIAIFPKDGNTDQELVSFADQQMYKNKLAGRTPG